MCSPIEGACVYIIVSICEKTTTTQQHKNNKTTCLYVFSRDLMLCLCWRFTCYCYIICRIVNDDLMICAYVRKSSWLGHESIMLSETLSSTECSMCLWRIGSSLSFKGGTESNSKYISLSFSHSRGYKAYQNWLKFWDVDFEGATVIVKSSLKEKELL